jgi:pantoate--beta-alanine ligase
VIITDKSATFKELMQAQPSKGFVPTMGALHAGHLSLINLSKKDNTFTAVSIFVNRHQFNNAADFSNYPNTLEKDIQLLESIGCDLLFIPNESELYPEGDSLSDYDFGTLDQVMEGKHRPGHFKGVANVVQRLFSLSEPCNAYFGEKDFQQIAVIKKLLQFTHQAVNIIPCPVIREENGLAMSSRNMRLSDSAKKQAAFIYQALNDFKIALVSSESTNLRLHQLECVNRINAVQGFEVEYLEIADAENLLPIIEWPVTFPARVFVAVHVEGIRLIDNLALN